MTTETVDRKRYKTAHHNIKVEVDMAEPALVAAAFDLMRQLARAHGMSNVGSVHINLSVEFDGQTWLAQVDEMEARLENLWLGQITKHEMTPLREADEPKRTIRYG